MSVIKGSNVTIKENTYLGENVLIEDDVYIDYGCIIRDNVTIKKGTTIGANCILGEYQMDFYENNQCQKAHPLMIGKNAIIRSGTVIYGDTVIGDDFQTGHNVTIREKTMIGHHVSAGTLTDIQGNCEIGNYVRMHSNVHIGMLSRIEDFVWIFPYSVVTNDPTPPSYKLKGALLKKFSVICTGSIILPGVVVEGDFLVAAGAVVTKDVQAGVVVAGNPAKIISDISQIKDEETGENVYPWRYTFKRGMPWEDTDYDSWSKLNHYE